MLFSSSMVFMNHTELMFQDLLLYCTKKVPKNHNHFFHFRHGGETHFLVLAQTLMYPNLDTPSQALFNLHSSSAFPIDYGSEDDQNFQSPPGHSRRPVRRRWYCMVLVMCHVSCVKCQVSGVNIYMYM